MRQSVPSEGRAETTQKTSYSRTSPLHPVPYHLPRKSVSTLLYLGTIRSTKFASKKKSDDCNVKVTDVTYKLHPDIMS